MQTPPGNISNKKNSSTPSKTYAPVRQRRILKYLFIFLAGLLSSFLILSIAVYAFFISEFQDRVFPGVRVAGTDVSGLTKNEIVSSFKDPPFDNILIELTSEQASFSALGKDIGLGVNRELMAQRAYSIGRQSNNPYYNLLQILSATEGEINLPLEISLDIAQLNKSLDQIAPKVEKGPTEAVFQFTPNVGPDGRGRVEAFKKSENGVAIDRDRAVQQIIERAKRDYYEHSDYWTLLLPTKTIYPEVRSSTAEELGIKDLLGSGQSYFYDSIPGRIFNIGLGAQKVSGRLVGPNEVFSFNESIGTVSALFGFQKAYAIIKGRTVLDDGGGVCQVSTTLYRAVLKAGLPVLEREAHTYRVGFYEQGGFLPGIDATIYPPKPDFKFKNDTGHWVLVQATFDKEASKLTFDIFGTNDGRLTTIEGPFFISTSPPPEPVYEDDPTLPVGQVRQVDTAHPGAKVYFKRKVTRDDQTLIDETVTSNYVPWPARFLRGTKT